MLDAYLAGSGGRVVIPEAVQVLQGDDPLDDDVRFVDAEGRTLVMFKRKDLIMYMNDGTRLRLLDALQVGGPGITF